MNVNILTEEQAKSIALECSIQALENFIKNFLPKLLPQQNTEKEVLFTKKQLASYWQCHEQTITQKKLKGELPFIQHGRKLLFRKSEIDKLTTNKLSQLSKF